MIRLKPCKESNYNVNMMAFFMQQFKVFLDELNIGVEEVYIRVISHHNMGNS